MASISYLLRRSRRIFLQMHNLQQVQRIANKRWTSFSSNLLQMIKNETEIQEEKNYGPYGLNDRALLQIAQLAFKRRQRFVQNAFEQRDRLVINFDSQDDRNKVSKHRGMLTPARSMSLIDVNSGSKSSGEVQSSSAHLIAKPRIKGK